MCYVKQSDLLTDSKYWTGCKLICDMILSPGNGPSWALSRWLPCSPRLSSIIFVWWWRGPRAGPRRLRAGDICWGGCSAALHTVWWRHTTSNTGSTTSKHFRQHSNMLGLHNIHTEYWLSWVDIIGDEASKKLKIVTYHNNKSPDENCNQYPGLCKSKPPYFYECGISHVIWE